MKPPTSIPGAGSDPIGAAILEYLGRHPDAQDTARGIADWWLARCGLRCSRKTLEEVLDRLVAEGWLTRRTAADGRRHYRRAPDRDLRPPPEP